MLTYVCIFHLLADAIYNDREFHLAGHIQIVRKVIHNFMNSFMKHLSGQVNFKGMC